MAASNQFDVASFFAWLRQYPALTVGLTIFTLILLVIDVGGWLSAKFSLYPGAPLHFDLNRLSFYLLYHKGIFHWLLNIVGLVTPLSIFERTHGTVYTGITLNLLTVIAGLQYCFVGLLLYPNTHVVGLSGIVFSFLTFFAYKEHFHTPTYTLRLLNREVLIPTLWIPGGFLLLTFIFAPGSSLFGHLFGITTGFLLAKGYIKVLYPPSKVILFIEDKLAGGIDKLDGLVTFYRESDAIDIRGVGYSPLFSQDPESAFGRGGQPLGTNE